MAPGPKRICLIYGTVILVRYYDDHYNRRIEHESADLRGYKIGTCMTNIQ